jgi:phosphatidylserine decarboxylase
VVRSWYVPVRSPRDGQDGAGGEGSRIVMWLRSDEGDDIVLVIISRRFVSPRCYLQLGQRTGQGQRCGYVPFGSRVEVLLPLSTRIRVAVDDVVRAGSDVIATLVHK